MGLPRFTVQRVSPVRSSSAYMTPLPLPTYATPLATTGVATTSPSVGAPPLQADDPLAAAGVPARMRGVAAEHRRRRLGVRRRSGYGGHQ